MFILTGSGDIQFQAQAPKALKSFSFFLLPKHIGMRCPQHIFSKSRHDNESRSESCECSCLGHFLGSLGPGVPTLGSLEHETVFVISPCYLRQDSYLIETLIQTERRNRHRRAMARLLQNN